MLLKKSDLVFEKDQIEEIFKILDADGSCHITIDEFQQLSRNDKELMKFRRIMRKVRDETVKASY